MDELFSVRESAKFLGCSEAFLRKWLHRGRLPHVKVGRLTRVRRSDLEAWLRVGLQPGLNGAAKPAQEIGRRGAKWTSR